MSKQDLENIETEVHLQTGDEKVDTFKPEERTEELTEVKKELNEKAAESENSELHEPNHEKPDPEETALEIDQKSIDNLQTTADNSLNQHEPSVQHNQADLQNETQTAATEDEVLFTELVQKQENTEEMVEEKANSEILDNLTGKGSEEAGVKANKTVSETKISTNTEQNTPPEQSAADLYADLVLDERQKELVKNMSVEDRIKYLRTMSMIQKSKIETQKTLDRLDITMKGLKQTQEDLQKTSDKFKLLNRGMENVMKEAVSKFSQAFGADASYDNYQEEDHFSSVPEISDVDTVAEKIVTKSNIVIFTGPGISSGSGLPDFKVDQPTWTLKNGQDKIDVDELLTKKFFDEKPEEVWRWHHQWRKMVTNSAPNDGHYMLADMQTQCKELGINFTLITQNIDSFHVDSYVRSESKTKKNYFEETKGGGMNMDQDSTEYGFCKDVYEINGNINYMRCAKNCSQKLFPSPLGCPEYFIPQCPECKGTARPHTKFNDEDSDEYFHKNTAVQDKIAYCDCVIVIGSRLETNFASTLVSQAMSSGALIVEISAMPVLEFGNVKQLIGFTEELVPMLCFAIREKLGKFTPYQG